MTDIRRGLEETKQQLAAMQTKLSNEETAMAVAEAEFDRAARAAYRDAKQDDQDDADPKTGAESVSAAARAMVIRAVTEKPTGLRSAAIILFAKVHGWELSSSGKDALYTAISKLSKSGEIAFEGEGNKRLYFAKGAREGKAKK